MTKVQNEPVEILEGNPSDSCVETGLNQLSSPEIRMFRFDFEVDNEATSPESGASCTNDEDSETELEPFHEVEMISELPKETPEITELLGVRHFSDVLKEDDLYQKTETAHTDLIPRVYEGGFKVWECTIDLIKVLSNRLELIKDKCVLDLGCGAGLVGLYCAEHKAKEVHFHDYNAPVLRHLTAPNCKLLRNSDVKLRFFCGDWALFEAPTKYDLIVTSETIYRQENYKSLLDLFTHCLKPGGLVIVAAKAVYFGVGGSVHEFQESCKQSLWNVQTLWKENADVPREVFALKR